MKPIGEMGRADLAAYVQEHLRDIPVAREHDATPLTRYRPATIARSL